MDKRQRRGRFHLQKEATLGYCLKDVEDFASDIKDHEWKCPFCDDHRLRVPKEDEIEAWVKCSELINSHLSAHRSILLNKSTAEELLKYEKHKTGNRARIWVSGTMKDRRCQY